MIQTFFIFLIKKQIWVSICFLMLSIFFQIYLGVVNIPLLIVLFLSTLSMYNLAIKPNIISSNKVFAKELLNTSSVLWIGLPLAIAIIIGFLNLKPFTIICLGFLALLSAQYSVPIFGRRLREIGSFKIFIISIVWATSIIFVPLLEYSVKFSFNHVLLWLCVLLFTFSISIPFDLRDMNADVTSLKTFPQRFGKEQSLNTANISLVVSAAIFLILQENITSLFSLSYLGGIFYAAFFFKRSYKYAKPYYVSFWIEGASIIPILIYSILNVSN